MMMSKVAGYRLLVEKILADDKEMPARIRLAAEYQKKAVCALLPEGMENHVDIISNELKLIVKEIIHDEVFDNSNIRMAEKEKKHGSRKIDIG